MKSERDGHNKDLAKTYHDHSHPNGGQLGADNYTSIPNLAYNGRTHQGTPVLPSPKNEPFAARRNPRTLEALRQPVHREISAPMLCLDKYSNA